MAMAMAWDGGGDGRDRGFALEGTLWGADHTLVFNIKLMKGWACPSLATGGIQTGEPHNRCPK